MPGQRWLKDIFLPGMKTGNLFVANCGEQMPLAGNDNPAHKHRSIDG